MQKEKKYTEKNKDRQEIRYNDRNTMTERGSKQREQIQTKIERQITKYKIINRKNIARKTKIKKNDKQRNRINEVQTVKQQNRMTKCKHKKE